jgi:hypothetical protein
MTFKEHPAFVPPETSEYQIWRYMDFTKFVSMLASKSLYFTNLKKMSEQDAFEGLLPDTFFDCRSWEKVEDIPERWRLTTHPLTGQTPQELDEAKSRVENVAKLVFQLRKTLYINCWHMKDYDSTAMWSVYASRGSGIAITSSYKLLQDSFPSDKALFGGKIVYADYSTDIIAPIDPDIILTTSTWKRRSFDFEREFRVVFWDDSNVNNPSELEKAVVPNGQEIRCDLSNLIDKIYVSPKSEDWFLELVKSVIQTYGLSKEVLRSPLDACPLRSCAKHPAPAYAA